jgi:drug/metabolite transporter (DMT)-like permease
MATESQPRAHKAGAFDIRLIIALLIGVYGVILTVMGIGFTSDEEIAKAAGTNINLWAGIGMLVVAALFVIWAKLRPLLVPVETETDGTPSGAGE